MQCLNNSLTRQTGTTGQLVNSQTMSCHLDTVADELACPSKRRLPVADAGVRDDVLAYLFLLNSFFLHYDDPSMSKVLFCIICSQPEIATVGVHEPPLLMKPYSSDFRTRVRVVE